MNTELSAIRHSPDTVAVIGLGVAGLGATKNLVEQGFNVVAFERNPSIGGLWTFNTDPNQTTVLKTTKANGSKQSSCYHDFPFRDDVPDYPSAQQTSDYIHDYARHFGLEKHFRLNTAIEYISLSLSDPNPSSTSSSPSPSPSLTDPTLNNKSLPGDQAQRWDVRIRDQDGVRTESFAKVVVTSGPWGKPYMPDIPGHEGFEGKIMHAQSYKGSEGFEGKKVVVVGMSNTGCDAAVDLCRGGAEVYISHRSGVRLLKRADPPLDHQISRRRFRIGAWMNENYPNLTSALANRAMAWKLHREMPEIKKEWGLTPAPPLTSSPGVVNDHVTTLMAENKIHNLFGILRFTSTGVITRTTSLASPASKLNEKVEEVETPTDVVIFSTAFDFDYSFLSPQADPSNYPQPEWEAIRGKTNNLRFPRLYQTMFHLDHPQSLAFIGPWRGFSIAAFSNSDLISQAIAQVWKGNYNLPNRAEMDRWVEKYYQRSIAQAKVWRIAKIAPEPRALEMWLNKVADTGVNEKLGWGMEGWKFWWGDRKLYGLIMDGVNSPHVYKLFEGKRGSREKWDGAREAIFKANGKG